MSEVFSIQIHNRKLFEQGGQGVWLELPTTTDRLQEAMRQIGISSDNPQDFFINGYSSPEDRRLALPYDMVLSAGVDELNYLAARLEPLAPAEVAELNAALTRPHEGFASIGQIIDYPDNVEYFIHLPGVDTQSALGDYYLHKSGMVEMPEEWKGGIDPYRFGSHIAKLEQGQFTPYGYLVNSGDEWQRVHEGQPVPEQYRVMGFPPPQTDRAEMRTAQAQALTEPQPAGPIILKGKTRDEYMKEITDRLETGIQELMDSDRYKSYLTAMSKFHGYSFRNTMLIHMQKPDASLVAGLTKWQSEFERTRKRGERGLKILAPKPYTARKRVPKLDPATGQPITGPDGKPVTEEQEVTVPNFIVVSVYDISQTEGKEVPDVTMNVLDGDVDRYDDFLSALKQSTPYSFALEEINNGSNGYCNYGNRHIGIKEGMGQLQTVETSIHEVTHARLYEKNRKLPDKKQPDQATREVQAESVAFAVCQYFGLDTSGFSFGYIADWGTGRDMKELKASLETIRATANELINEIEFHFAELQKQREQTNQQEAPTPEQVKAQNEKAPEPEQPTFTIYQLKRGEELRAYRFEPYERLQAAGLSVDPANYEQIYTAPLEPGMTLGDIDVKFNLNHPADFTGHSLSVSDVVVLHQDGKDTAHYYDSIGFQDVPEFLQEREAVQEQEAVYQIGDNYLSIQTCESGYDYTLYDRTFQPGDGGQLDNPALTFEAAKDEIAALHGMSGLPCESVTPADFEKMQETYNQQPSVTINFSENGELEQGDVLPYGLAERTFERLDREARAERDDPDKGRYYKTDFTVTYMMEGQLYEYSGRQDFGDGDGPLSDHIRGHAEHYRNNPQYQAYLASKGIQKEENESYDFTLNHFVPYLKLHANLSEMERTAKSAVEELQAKGITAPEDTARLNYYTALQAYAIQSRVELNTSAAPELPPMPKLDDYLKTAEMTLEQNPDMFDGVLNNMPTASEREAKERAGEPQAGASTPAAPTEQPEETKQTEAGTAVRYYAINETAARHAKEANSFYDYKPGSATAEYRQYVDEAVELAERQKKRVDPQYHEKIDYLLDLYCRKLAENMNHRFAIDARVPSVLIAGPANFPVRQKEKQNAARDSNMEEWQHIRGLLDKIRSTGMGGISADDPQAVKKLQDKLEKLEQLQETMKSVNAYYRKHKTLDGCPHLSAEMLEKLQAGMAGSWRKEPKPFESYQLSNNNQEIHRLKDRIQALTRRAELGYVGWEFDGGHVEANQPDNRLQIFFDEKPDADTREMLKGNGFRWSPKAGAWQRQLNDNAIYAADQIKCIAPLSGERPTDLQKKARREKEKPSIRAQLKAEKPAEPKKAAPEKSKEMEVV